MEKQIKKATLKSLDDDGRGSAVFATLNVVDKDGDITEPGAFGEQDVVLLPSHDWNSVPLGKGKTREVGDQAIVDFRLNLETQAGKDWHAALKFDMNNGQPVQEWSYGFTIRDASEDLRDGERVRILKSLDVHEVSPVVLGAGEGTRTLAVKSRKFADHIADTIGEVQDIARRAAEIREKRREDGKSDVSPQRAEQLKTLVEELRNLSDHAKALEEFHEPEENGSDAVELMAKVMHDRWRSGRL